MPMVPVVTGLSQFPEVSIHGIRLNWTYGMRVNSTKYLEEVQTTQHPSPNKVRHSDVKIFVEKDTTESSAIYQDSL